MIVVCCSLFVVRCVFLLCVCVAFVVVCCCYMFDARCSLVVCLSLLVVVFCLLCVSI